MRSSHAKIISNFGPPRAAKGILTFTWTCLPWYRRRHRATASRPYSCGDTSQKIICKPISRSVFLSCPDVRYQCASFKILLDTGKWIRLTHLIGMYRNSRGKVTTNLHGGWFSDVGIKRETAQITTLDLRCPAARIRTQPGQCDIYTITKLVCICERRRLKGTGDATRSGVAVVCVCVCVYYTAFSSEARAVPYLLQGVWFI